MWLQLLFYNRKRPFDEWMAATGGESNQYIWKQRRFQVLISNKGSTLKILDHCQVGSWNNNGATQISIDTRRPFNVGKTSYDVVRRLNDVVCLQGCMAASSTLKLQYALNRNTCQIHCIYTIYGCKCCSKINTVSIKEWMAATNFLK